MHIEICSYLPILASTTRSPRIYRHMLSLAHNTGYSMGGQLSRQCVSPPLPFTPPLDTTAAIPSGATGTVSIGSRFRGLYQFDSRNADELSFNPGDIINVGRRCLIAFIQY